MAATTAQRDPRTCVTPDAFEVSDTLLGLPLAKPGRRLVAMIIDLIVIGVLTAVTRTFALVLGVVAAVLLVRAGLRRTPVEGSVFGRAMRLSVGCLGVLIAIATVVVWASCGIGVQSDSGNEEAVSGAVGARGAAGRVLARLAALGLADAFRKAETLEEAETVTRDVIDVAADAGIERAELRRMLAQAVPDDAAWAGQADAMFDRVLAEASDEPATPPPPLTEGAASATVAGYTLEEALAAYGEALRADDGTDEARLRLQALRSRLASDIAADTLAALGERIDDLEETNRRQADRLETATEALTDATSGGLFNWAREFVDELGFGFGWASLYLTVMLSWWNGQTVGKRLLGLRVLRLDGKPITWWVAFERAGGYAAGFATGLLGFAQVYWDANRQAIHDRIVGTVVVLDKAERIGDWESAL